MQPLIAGYSITPAWDNVSRHGCLDHAADPNAVRGYHAVLIVAHGNLEGMTHGPFVWVENSWGRNWGWHGVAAMSEPLHQQLCHELWTII